MIKAAYIIGIIATTVFAFVLMLGMQGATNELVATANSTGNWTAAPDFEMAQGVINSYPIWQYFVMAAGSLILIAWVARKRD